MGAKKAFLFLVAVVILQITIATESELSIDLIKLDENIDPRVFTCPEPGIYPDLDNCLKYHQCLATQMPTDKSNIFDETIVRAATDNPATCENGYGFDPKTGRCSLALDDGQCPEIVPDCIQPYQMGPLVRNPSLYYVCVNSPTGLVPELRACPMDQIHDGLGCITNTPPTGVNHMGVCIKAGDFYHPNDCTKHRVCSGPGVTPVDKKCATYYKFNWRTQKCELFNCNNHNM